MVRKDCAMCWVVTDAERWRGSLGGGEGERGEGGRGGRVKGEGGEGGRG